MAEELLNAGAVPERGALYPIRVVAEETGVNSVTLRAWERRYNFIKPHRTGKGHRLYSKRDIELIKQVVSFLEQGGSLSGVSSLLSNPAATESDSSIAVAVDTEVARDTPSEDSEPWSDYMNQMLSAVEQFDEQRLDTLYNQYMSIYPVHIVMTNILLPLLKVLGERWQQKVGAIAEEHFFGVYLRNKLGARLHHSQPSSRGRRLVAACMPGEYHEVGLLLFALVAREHGFRLVLLGANTPLSELPEVVRRSGADGVVLSLTGVFSDESQQQLTQLVSEVSVPVLIGGKGADMFSEDLQACGVTLAGSELITGIRTVKSTLGVITTP